VVAHEGWKAYGFGAEIAAQVMEDAFDYLDAPVERVGAPGAPMPYNANLEKQMIPGASQIVDAARRACDLLVAARRYRSADRTAFFSHARAID
jgi:pyruvate/2-oxoglutarate/acetoin dehydrogenase E1 component